MKRFLGVIFSLGGLLGGLSAAAQPQADAGQTVHETLVGMFWRYDPILMGWLDVDSQRELDFTDLPPGLVQLYSSRRNTVESLDSASRLVLIVHGLDETGHSWDRPVRRLVADPRNLVLVFIWTKWNRLASVQYWLGHDLNALLDGFSGRLPRFTVLAHSAGAVLLLEALCINRAWRHCVWDPARNRGSRVEFHAIAGPLRGYGEPLAPLASVFAGFITAHLAGEITYAFVDPTAELHFWFTSFDRDGTLFRQADREVRVPRFSGTQPAYEIHALPDSTHEGAVEEVVNRLLD